MTTDEGPVQKILDLLEPLPQPLKSQIGRQLLGQDVNLIPPAKRWCYVVQIGQTSEGQYVPSIVVEDEPGHAPMVGRGEHAVPWRWGSDFDKAREIADRCNAEMGVSRDEAQDIVASSIRAGNAADQQREAARQRLDRSELI